MPPEPSAATASEPAARLCELSDDLLARVLICLREPRAVCALALCCRRLAAVAADDRRVWMPLCHMHWSAVTEPAAWLSPAAERTIGASTSSAAIRMCSRRDADSDSEDAPPTTYRSVFAVLRRTQRLVGMWRGLGDQPHGSLFRVAWAGPGGGGGGTSGCGGGGNASGRGARGSDAGGSGSGARPAGHVEVVALRCGRGASEVVEETLARVGPGFPALRLELVDESRAVLKEAPQGDADLRRSPSGGPAGRGASAAALAAAAVATGTHALSLRDDDGSGGPLGSSPPSSFGYEMLRFMAGSVAGSRSGGRKNRQRGAGPPAAPGAAPQPTILQHLARLHVPPPTRQRPLNGLWAGVYGPHGMEVVSVTYENGRIMGTKVVGDPNVPAGQTSFWASAEPLPHPWPTSEVELITNRPVYTSNPAAALAAAVAAAAAAAREGGPPRPGVLVTPVWALPAVAVAAANAAAAGGEGDPQAEVQAQLAAAAAAAAANAHLVDLHHVLVPGGGAAVGAGAAAAAAAAEGAGSRGGGGGGGAPGLAGAGAPGARAGGEGGGVGGRGLPPVPPPPPPTRVLAVFPGMGRVAGNGFSNPNWIEGRLWVYDDGSCGFLWRGEFDFLVDLRRL